MHSLPTPRPPQPSRRRATSSWDTNARLALLAAASQELVVRIEDPQPASRPCCPRCGPRQPNKRPSGRNTAQHKKTLCEPFRKLRESVPVTGFQAQTVCCSWSPARRCYSHVKHSTIRQHACCVRRQSARSGGGRTKRRVARVVPATAAALGPDVWR
jgi:hypothetical protein